MSLPFLRGPSTYSPGVTRPVEHDLTIHCLARRLRDGEAKAHGRSQQDLMTMEANPTLDPDVNTRTIKPATTA
jgi:hypothetical protein